MFVKANILLNVKQLPDHSLCNFIIRTGCKRKQILLTITCYNRNVDQPKYCQNMNWIIKTYDYIIGNWEKLEEFDIYLITVRLSTAAIKMNNIYIFKPHKNAICLWGNASKFHRQDTTHKIFEVLLRKPKYKLWLVSIIEVSSACLNRWSETNQRDSILLCTW